MAFSSQVVAMSENADGPRKLLAQNIKCDMFCDDIFKRDHSVLPAERAESYSAGFPCRAFSQLRTEARCAFSFSLN